MLFAQGIEQVAMIRFALIGLVALAAMACDKGASEMEPEKITVRGVTYEFPKEDILTAAVPPASGRLFVRLSPPGKQFDLILDELSHYSPNQQGADIPTISRLNDVRFETFKVTHFAWGPVICGRAQPKFNCGLRIEDGAVRWSVLFDKERLQESEQIRAQAWSIIQSYRSAHG